MTHHLTKGLHCIAAALTLFFAQTAFAQDEVYVPPEDEMVEARAIMDVMFPPDTREDMMVEISSSMGVQAASGFMKGPVFEEPGIRAIVDRFLTDLPATMRPAISKHLPSLMEATAIAYTREFTLEELRDIRAFASTPSGQRYFSTIQPLMNDPAVQEANSAFFEDIAVISQQQSAAVQQAVVEYLQANPEVLERLQEAGVGS